MKSVLVCIYSDESDSLRRPFKRKILQAESIVDTLCSNMISGSEQLRDVSSIALKTVISELPPSNASLTSNVIKRVVPKLTDALSKLLTFLFIQLLTFFCYL